jgi:gliding motility-associated-like protein
LNYNKEGGQTPPSLLINRIDYGILLLLNKMRFHLYIILFLTLLVGFTDATAQNNGGVANWWMFGDSLAMNFNGLTPQISTNSGMFARMSPVSVSDKQGNLLFYAKATELFDASHQVMQNGILDVQSKFYVPQFGIHTLAVKKPCSNTEYFFFYYEKENNPIHFDLKVALIDMSLNNGLGAVVYKDSLIHHMADPSIASTVHSDNNSVWVVIRDKLQAIYYSYHITPAGIQNNPTISNIGFPSDVNSYGPSLRFSPDGSHLLACHGCGNTVNCDTNDYNRFQLFGFDRSTGQLNNHRPLNYPASYISIPAVSAFPNFRFPLEGEFSRDGNMVYLRNVHNVNFKFNLSSPHDTLVRMFNQVYPSGESDSSFSSMRIGPDGKMYGIFFDTNATLRLARIPNPNNPIQYPGLTDTIINLPRDPWFGLPRFPTSNLLNRSITYSDSCQFNQVALSLVDTQFLDSAVWDFGDGTSMSSTQFPVQHSYANPGSYAISAALFHGCEVDSVFDTITIYTQPSADLGPDTILCEGDTLDLAFTDTSFNYLWSTGDTNLNLRILLPDTYSIAVSNVCGVATDTVVIDSLIPALVHLPSDTLLCLGDTLELDATVALGSYLWSTGSTQPMYNVTQAGIYHVTATNFCGTDSDTIQVDYTQPPNLFLGNDTVLCAGDTLVLDATDTLSTYLWNSGDTAALDTVVQSGVYYATVTNLCGTDSDTLQAWFLQVPTANLGADTVLCAGSSLMLHDTTLFGSYTWSTGGSQDSITVTQPGMYALTVSNLCGVASDTIAVDFDTIPVIDLGSDTTLCLGQSITLNAAFSRASYLWSNGTTDSTLVINQEGVYHVTTTNLCGTATDSLTLDVDSTLQVDLGNDTILCLGDLIKLRSNVQGDFYSWNVGYSADSLVVSQQDTYSLSVSNVCGIFRDTIAVYYDNSPITNLGPDTSYCITDLILLDATWSRANYLWQDGSNGNTNLADSTGQYWVEVTNLCGYDGDTVKIFYHTPMSFTLGADTLICDGDSILISAQGNNANYQWNTGDTDSLIYGYAGNYYTVRATNLCGTVSDSITLGAIYPPEVDFPQSDTLCEGEVLDVEVSSSNSPNILWNDGSTNWNRSFDQAGTYTASINNQCGTYTNSISLGIVPVPEPYLGTDTLLCIGEEMALTLNGYPNHTYSWSTGETDSAITIQEDGVYSVTVTSPYNCEGYDEIEVRACGTTLYIPTAFTPNGDGLNDEFKIEGTDITRFYIAIYNRWGNQVFESTDPTQAWNGTFQNQGEPVNPGVFTYVLWYASGQYQSEEISGLLNLIR